MLLNYFGFEKKILLGNKPRCSLWPDCSICNSENKNNVKSKPCCTICNSEYENNTIEFSKERKKYRKITDEHELNAAFDIYLAERDEKLSEAQRREEGKVY